MLVLVSYVLGPTLMTSSSGQGAVVMMLIATLTAHRCDEQRALGVVRRCVGADGVYDFATLHSLPPRAQ